MAIEKYKEVMQILDYTKYPFINETNLSVADVKDFIDCQKAEIERLQNIIVGFMDEVGTWSNKYDVDISNIHKLPLLAKEDYDIRIKIQTTAIKNFWEALKRKKQWDVDIPDYIFIADGDNFVKEIT